MKLLEIISDDSNNFKNNPNRSGEKIQPFLNSTGLPTYDDMERLPDYFKKEKGLTFENVMMSPIEYLKRVAAGFKLENPDLSDDDATATQQNLVDEYAQAMLNGEKFPKLMLRYQYDKQGNFVDFGQEGRHRAAAAIKIGVKEVPVIVVHGKSHY